jgi:hypothetical protein
VSWPDSWENVTIVVKAKSYQGECIGAGNPYSGIIVYWLTINPVRSWWARYSFLGGAASDGSNATVNDDGLVDWWTSWVDMQTNPGRAGLKSGPFDIIDYDTSKNPKGFEPKWFAGNFSDPRNAWVAHAAKIFKVFHEHTWYSIKDNLSYAMVFIYDLDHTPAGSESSLLEACITSGTGDGQCRYNREIYPPQALNYRGFQDNTLVPIPLQIMNLRNQTPFHGGIGAPETNIRIGAPHLNATKRVYWETVLVNQTLYAGREYNGTGTWPRADPDDPGFKRRPDFGAYPTATTATGAYLYPAITQGGIKGVPAGPLSIAHNNTITTSTSGNSYRFAAAANLGQQDFRLDTDNLVIPPVTSIGVGSAADSIRVGADPDELVCTFSGFVRAPSQTGTVRCAGWIRVEIDYDTVPYTGPAENEFFVWVEGQAPLTVELDPDTNVVTFSSPTFNIEGTALVDVDLDGSADDRVRVIFRATVSSTDLAFNPFVSEITGTSISVTFDTIDENVEIDINNNGSDEVKLDLAEPAIITITPPIALGDEFDIPATLTLTGSSTVDYDGDGSADDTISSTITLNCRLMGVVDENPAFAAQRGWIECVGTARKTVSLATPAAGWPTSFDSGTFTVRAIGTITITTTAPITGTITIDPDHAKVRGITYANMDVNPRVERVLVDGAAAANGLIRHTPAAGISWSYTRSPATNPYGTLTISAGDLTTDNNIRDPIRGPMLVIRSEADINVDLNGNGLIDAGEALNTGVDLNGDGSVGTTTGFLVFGAAPNTVAIWDAGANILITPLAEAVNRIDINGDGTPEVNTAIDFNANLAISGATSPVRPLVEIRDQAPAGPTPAGDYWMVDTDGDGAITAADTLYGFDLNTDGDVGDSFDGAAFGGLSGFSFAVTGTTSLETTSVPTTIHRQGLWLGREVKYNFTSVANFNNNTVFYTRVCAQDSDLNINHPEIGDLLIGAEVTINFKTKTDTPYYLSHNIATTDHTGCAGRHKWPGNLVRGFFRYPNGTNWNERGSLNVTKHFDPLDDRSRAMLHFETSWASSNALGPKENTKDEMFEKYGVRVANYTMLIPDIQYVKTRTLTDDKDWDGFNIQVKYKAGPRSRYGGMERLVDEVRVKNPYAIALMVDYKDWTGIGFHNIFGEWVFPYTPLNPSCVLIKFHEPVLLEIETEQGDIIEAEVAGEVCITGLEELYADISYDQEARPYIDERDLEIYAYWGIMFSKGGTIIVDGEEVDKIGEIYYIENANRTKITVKADNVFDEVYAEFGYYGTGGLVDLNLDQTIDATNVASLEADDFVGSVQLTQHGTIVLSAFSAEFLEVEDKDGDEIWSIDYFVGSLVGWPVTRLEIYKYALGEVYAEDTDLDLSFEGSHTGQITNRVWVDTGGIWSIGPIGSRARITYIGTLSEYVEARIKHDTEITGQIYQGYLEWNVFDLPDHCQGPLDTASITLTSVTPSFTSPWTTTVTATGTFSDLRAATSGGIGCRLEETGTWSGSDDPLTAGAGTLTFTGTYTLTVWSDTDGDAVIDPGETIIAQVSGSMTGTGTLLAQKDPNRLIVTIVNKDFTKLTGTAFVDATPTIDATFTGFTATFTSLGTATPAASIDIDPPGTGVGTWTDVDRFTGTFTLSVPESTEIELYGLIVDLGDQDFAIPGTGHVFVFADVFDLAFILEDNMGNPLPLANTAATLYLNGAPLVTLTPGPDPEIEGSLAKSYRRHGEGWAVFYQLPGHQSYGIAVTFQGSLVYDNPAEVPKLTKTEIIEIHTEVFKLKLLLLDCEGQTLQRAYVEVLHPSLGRQILLTDSFGAIDLGYVVRGNLTIRAVWWKGVWLSFSKAVLGTSELTLQPDGSLRVTSDRNYDSPIKLYAPIFNIVFTPWDYNMDIRIPRLNITLTWVGVAPLTRDKLYFLETLDPSGDTWDGNLPGPDPSDDGNPRNDFNTSANLHQWFSYRIEYRQGQVSDSAGIRQYGLVQYIFYQMPPTYYNITVTTVPHLVAPNGQGGEDWSTPSTSKWPGRPEVVDYEIKIAWGQADVSRFTLDDLRKPPRIVKSPGTYANDRVVLRVFGTIDGTPVTDPNLNPGGVGNQTARVCGTRQIDLATWAHNFYKRIVDGDFDYLTQATRIGNVTFFIRNDNGKDMEHYDPVAKVWVEQHTTKWTEDLFNPSRIKSTSEWSSTIWWNGSYAIHTLRFRSYVYPLQLSRGEQPWARFYDKVGLTTTGWPTTEEADADDREPGDDFPRSFLVDRFFNVSTSRTQNATWPTHNFTVVGNEGLWNQQKWRWEGAVAQGLVPEVPSKPYSLVFEKEVLIAPIPVGFITLNLKDEDLARAISYAVVQLDVYTRASRTDPAGTRLAGYKYKTGRDGNLTLLLPTQEMMENILSASGLGPYVRNYTLTVYWYLNSSIVYKDAFNLTKRGYNVEKVAIADVTFVLAISADKDRPVKDLYARIWWFNVSTTGTGEADRVYPGRITVDHARKTWTYTAVPETRGAAKWTDGKITLPWLPTSERFTKTDYDLVFDSAVGRWVYKEVTRSWDIPYPSNADGSMLAGWPYQPKPTSYYRRLTYTEDFRIQYRVSVWSDQLPIDPSLPQYGRGAWSAAAPNPATGYNYELVWTRLSTGNTTPPIFRFAWMLFGHPPFDITWYRGPDATGPFEPIPGYALTRTWEKTPTPGSKTVAIKLNATDIQIPVFWQVGDLELGTYDCGPLVGYKVKGSVIPPKGATFSPITIDGTTTAGTITVGDKKIDICLAGKPVGLVSLRSGDTPATVIWGGSTLRITEVSPPDTIWADSTSPAAGKGTSSDYWKNWVGSATDPVTGKKVSEELVTGTQIAGPDLGIQYMGYGVPYEGVPREHTVIAFSNDPDNRAHRPFIKMFEFQNVSARITDFNGRALPGAFYQLIDSQTGKSAAWSYAGPEGRVVPMPIRKPGGVFIQRVFYLGQGPDGVPTWPVNSFAKWPVAYDSREDETTQEPYGMQEQTS